jgi:hypothetical protein
MRSLTSEERVGGSKDYQRSGDLSSEHMDVGFVAMVCWAGDSREVATPRMVRVIVEEEPELEPPIVDQVNTSRIPSRAR